MLHVTNNDCKYRVVELSGRKQAVFATLDTHWLEMVSHVKTSTNVRPEKAVAKGSAQTRSEASNADAWAFPSSYQIREVAEHRALEQLAQKTMAVVNRYTLPK